MEINGVDCGNVKITVTSENYELLVSVYFVAEGQHTQPQTVRLVGCHLVTEENVSVA
jgi:hypothetical protein